ncbi:MFS transporter [Agrobacterium vitis]|uniref:MFS transporter n=1 Tax=Agrobacterium vitis TaxID=373 RepID=UPI003D2CF8E2
MFSFFPFLVTLLTENYQFSATDVGGMMTIGVIAGNLSSVAICLFLSEGVYKSSFVLSLFLFSASLIGFHFIGNVEDHIFQYVSLVLCVVLYRLSVGLYYNMSRTYQIYTLKDEKDKLKLFSNIKFVNSIGGGLGALIGQLVINEGGYDALSYFCALLFFLCALIVLIFVPQISTSEKRNRIREIFEDAISVVREKVFIFFSIGAMFHYIFEAQIYTYISLKIKLNSIDNGIAYLFTMNSVFLIIFSLIGGRLLVNMNNISRIFLMCGGSLLSCLSLLLMPMVNGYPGLVVVAFIFSLGEYLVPQLAIDFITDATENTLQRITFFNFMTSAIGLGIGFYYGSYLYTLKSVMFVNIAWIVIFFMVCSFFTMGIRAHKSP